LILIEEEFPMAGVTVYRFKVYSAGVGDGLLSPRYATLDAIKKIRGAKPLMEQWIEIDSTRLDPHCPGMTARNFSPQLRATTR
jgi:hypothetical protein